MARRKEDAEGRPPLVKMPFGKYRGCQVEDLPREYLEWLADQDWLREPLASAVAEALSDRWDAGAVSRSTDLPADLRPVAQELVSIGYRALAQRLHPDHAGGDHKQMAQLNAAAAWLREKTA
jgi:hypothetical protein